MEQTTTTLPNNGPSTDLKRYLEFDVGGSMHAFKLTDVREVVALTKYSPSPQSSGCFIGYTAVRDEVVPLFDLRIFLGSPTTVTYDTSVVICHYMNKSVGIIVDIIHSVVSSNKAENAELPGESNASQDCILEVLKMDTYLTLVLDVGLFIKSSKAPKEHPALDDSDEAAEAKSA
jgi:purine-binding chemotaxis protein CheW